MTKLTHILFVAAGLLVSAPAFAQDEPDTQITGNTKINASVENAGTIAGGNGATATTDVGTISGSTINGNTEINASLKNAVTGAAGDDAVAATEVGTITDAKIDGNTTLNGSAENTFTGAGGKNSCASLRVASIGRKPCKKK